MCGADEVVEVKRGRRKKRVRCGVECVIRYGVIRISCVGKDEEEG